MSIDSAGTAARIAQAFRKAEATAPEPDCILDPRALLVEERRVLKAECEALHSLLRAKGMRLRHLERLLAVDSSPASG